MNKEKYCVIVALCYNIIIENKGVGKMKQQFKRGLYSGFFSYPNNLEPQKWEQIVEVNKNISELLKITDLDTVERCISSAIFSEREKLYMELNGVKRSKAQGCGIHRLIGKPCSAGCRTIGGDHEKLWIKDGKPYSLTSEPYVLNNKTLEELIYFCNENNLQFNITNDSFHFPTSTLFVEFKRKEES